MSAGSICDRSRSTSSTVPLVCDAAEIHCVANPPGTRGYDDLRRRANLEPLGEGLRPTVPLQTSSRAPLRRV